MSAVARLLWPIRGKKDTQRSIWFRQTTFANLLLYRKVYFVFFDFFSFTLFDLQCFILLYNIYVCHLGYPAEVGALFTTVSSISVSRVGRVRVTLTVTVRVSRVSVMVSVRDSVK